MQQESQAHKVLRLYHWLKRQGLDVKNARICAYMQAGIRVPRHWTYWKMR